jgi:transporter family-2 protein
MDMVFYAILLLAGVLQGVMVSLNGQLGNYYSLFGICFFVHGIALVLLAAYLLLVKREKLRFRGAPWYVYLVGAMGIAIVASSSWCTLRIGATAMLALSTAGQLISSQLIDQFGLFGMPKTKFTPRQIPGCLLVAGGVALVVFS